MVSQDRSKSRGLAGSRGHSTERSPRRASNPKRRTTSKNARSPTPGFRGEWEEDIQEGLDTTKGLGTMATAAASGSDQNPGTGRPKLLASSQPHKPVTDLPSPKTPKQSQELPGWMPPPPPPLPALLSPGPTTPMKQLFAYLCDTPEKWPEVQKSMVWWRGIIRDK